MSDPSFEREFLEPTPQSLPRLAVRPGQQAVLIGRHHLCNLVFSDPTVSRRHASLTREDDVWILRDLGSTNGTKVHGELTARAPLHPGDLIALGGLQLVFTELTTD
jgi:pSer/pThr/pTyr-binding forkhead associated (FHA) protein